MTANFPVVRPDSGPGSAAQASSSRFDEVRFSLHNVAGLKIPRFEEVIFEDPSYSVFATAYSFEMVLARMREAIALREEIRSSEGTGADLLSDGFRKTSQRINLYEQRLIPDCREAPCGRSPSISRTSRPPPSAWPRWPSVCRRETAYDP